MAQGKIEELATLEMALVGYQIEKEKIESRIREIQLELKGKPVVAPAKKAPGAKRVLSAAARRRISVAQRKRWAEHHRRMAQAGK
jgi:hypothetical protein